jgi:hypothetical protein
MEFDPQKELEPIPLGGGLLWKAFGKLIEDPTKTLPVTVKDPETGNETVALYLSLVFEENGMFFQAEGSDKIKFSKPWEEVQPEIFRFKI